MKLSARPYHHRSTIVWFMETSEGHILIYANMDRVRPSLVGVITNLGIPYTPVFRDSPVSWYDSTLFRPLNSEDSIQKCFKERRALKVSSFTNAKLCPEWYYKLFIPTDTLDEVKMNTACAEEGFQLIHPIFREIFKWNADILKTKKKSLCLVFCGLIFAKCYWQRWISKKNTFANL